MSTRRQAREWALQMLFQLDFNPEAEKTPEEIFAEFWGGGLRLPEPGREADAAPDAAARTFAERLVRGVMHDRDKIDRRTQARCPNWRIERMGAVERAVLRLATWELVFDPGPDRAPAAVAINEAVDLAKYFGTNESGRFVNGILDAIARRERDARAKAQSQAQSWSPAQPDGR